LSGVHIQDTQLFNRETSALRKHHGPAKTNAGRSTAVRRGGRIGTGWHVLYAQ
jgi:hypothetical protein